MRHLIVLLALVFAACGTEKPPGGDEPDAGPVGTPDAGRPDAGGPDAGSPDAGGPDAGGPDSGVTCGPASCAGCCDSAGSCRAGTENTACGLSGASCSDCVQGVCVTGHCETPVQPHAGDTCAAPIALQVDSNGFASATLDLTGLGDEAHSSCGEGGADAVVSFDVAKDDTYVELIVRSDDAGVRPLIAVRTTCDQRSSEALCTLAPVDAHSARISAFAQHGRFFAWVEAVGTASSPLHLELRLSPPGPGDFCSQPQALTLTNGTATLHDDLRRYGPDQLSCVEGARDAVYSFSLPALSQVAISAKSLTAGFEPTLRVGYSNSCTSPGCSASGLETAQFNGLLYYGYYDIIVSSKDLAAGEFELSVTTTPPPSGETCQEAFPLTFDSTGHAYAGVETSNHSDDFTLGCLGQPSGPDSVLHFRVDQPSDFSASIRETYPTYSHYNVMALRSACGGADLGCGTALSVANLTPGDYYLLVDSDASETNSLSVNAALTPPRAPGETCARPIPLALSNGAAGGTAQVSGTLSGAFNDIPSYCGSSADGYDQIYSITTDRELVVRATATRTDTPSGSLSLHRTNPERCATGYSLACQGGTTSATLASILPAGTHEFVVESGYTLGYTLDVSATPPTQGEFCANPFGVDFPAGGGTLTYQSSTRDSVQDSYNACPAYALPDRVYRITLTDPFSNLQVKSTARGSTNAPGIILVSTCEDVLSLGGSCDSTASATRVFHTTALPAGTYFLWVKGPTAAGTDYDLQISAAPTPPGDTCSVATPVTLSNGPAGGTATLTGTTVGMSDDFSACAWINPAPDHVYSVTLDRELDLRVKMTPQQSTAKGTLTLLEDSCSGGTSVCGQPDANGVATLLAGSLQPGTHYFSAEYFSGGPGDYSLEISASPHQPGETCSVPLPLAFSGGAAGGTAAVTLNLDDFFDDPLVDCGGTGTDTFFTFTTDRVLDLHASVQGSSSLGTAYISLVSSCDGPLSCTPLYSFSAPFAVGSLPPGTYVLAVDFWSQAQSASMTLQASLTPPTPGDTCANPIPLTFPDAGGTVTVTGDLSNAFDNPQPDYYCGTYLPDRVYTFTTTQPLSLLAQATTSTGAKAPSLSLRGGACNGSAVVCESGGLEESFLRAKDLPPGTYYLFVDKGTYDAPNDYTLKVTLGGRPAGDQCANALPLGLPASGPGQVTVQGDTRPFFDDVVPVCGTYPGPNTAPDTVYAFTTTTSMNLRLTVKPLTSGFRPTVALRQGCGTNDFDLRCDETPSYSSSAWTSYRALPPGTYYVVIDGYDSTEAGAFELSARLSAAEPVGESCANPQPVTLSQGTHGRATLTGSFPDYFEDISDCWNYFGGSDAVFALTTDSPRLLHARALGSPSVTQPTLSVRRSPCDQSSSQIACERSSYDGTSSVSTPLPGGTSYLMVKSGLSNPTGTFQLDVQVDDFEPGDVCTGALPLVLSNGAAGGTASASVDPYAFASDVKLSCDSSITPDTFFTFTTDRALNLSATVHRQNTSEPFSIGLLSGCGGAESACGNSGYYSGPLVLTKSALPAGTYVLVVRGGEVLPSGFTLDVSLTP
ncbi:MAG: hypothetical protein ACJ8AT_15590 [Hyalangium sp.]|uniref:hypothetical protein n=1 Tax=Hyalangium sp. TaxID=2028555 RepID=UPI00389A4331